MSRHLRAPRGCLNHLQAGSGVDYQSTGLTLGTELLPHHASQYAQARLDTATNMPAESHPSTAVIGLGGVEARRWRHTEGRTG